MNQKGGAGKTTLLMLTAAALHTRTNKKILVIDSDPQLSVKAIFKQENNPKSYDVFAFNWNQPKPEVNFEKVLTIAQGKYDVILMDLPGNVKTEEFYYSILFSDILIVPIVASMLDMNATEGFLEMIPEFQAKRPERPLEVFGVINKKDQTIEQKYLHNLAGRGGMKIFYSTLSNLVRYRRFVSTFQDITDKNIKDDEFNMYFDEFCTHCYL